MLTGSLTIWNLRSGQSQVLAPAGAGRSLLYDCAGRVVVPKTGPKIGPRQPAPLLLKPQGNQASTIFIRPPPPASARVQARPGHTP